MEPRCNPSFHFCFHFFISHNLSLCPFLDSCCFQSYSVGIECSTNGHEQFFRNKLSVSLELNVYTIMLNAYLYYLYSGKKFDLFLFQFSLKCFRYLGVFSRDCPLHDLKHCNICAKLIEYKSEFTANYASSNNDQTFWN